MLEELYLDDDDISSLPNGHNKSHTGSAPIASDTAISLVKPKLENGLFRDSLGWHQQAHLSHAERRNAPLTFRVGRLLSLLISELFADDDGTTSSPEHLLLRGARGNHDGMNSMTTHEIGLPPLPLLLGSWAAFAAILSMLFQSSQRIVCRKQWMTVGFCLRTACHN
jgi:hypothetical protein